MILLINATTSNNIESAIRFSAFHNSTRRSHRWRMHHNNTSSTTKVVAWNIHQQNRHEWSQTCCDRVFPSHCFNFLMGQHITSLLEFSSHQRRYPLSLSMRSLSSNPPFSCYRSSCSSSCGSRSSSSIPFASNDLTKTGFFSFQSQNLTSSSKNTESTGSTSKVGDTTRTMAEEMYMDTSNDQKPDFFVYYTVSINGQKSRLLTKVKVMPGDEIDDIRKEIKKENSNVLASVDAGQLELFKSVHEEEPLNALEAWNSSVTWGTKQQPLVVKVNPLMVAVIKSVAAVGKC